MDNRPVWILPAIAAVLMVVSLYLTFVWAPTEVTMGIVQRIFYTHVPAFFVGVVAIITGLIASIRFLITRDFRFDELAVASIEVGLIFDTMNLITGPFWAKPVWGIWWTWDARLTSAFVLWLMFVGYLILRQAIDDPTARATISAVVTVFQAVGAVIVYLANRIWRTQHPQPVIAGGSGSGLDADMWKVVLFSLGTMLVLFICLLQVRRRLERLRREVEGLRRTVHAA
jgi:heme exporter protein C